MNDSEIICRRSGSRGPSAQSESQLDGAAAQREDQNQESAGSLSLLAEGDTNIRIGDRLSRVGIRAFPAPPSVSARRSRLQKDLLKGEPTTLSGSRGPTETSDKGSLTPAMRKRYLKELFLTHSLSSGFGSILLSSRDECDGFQSDPPEEGSNRSFWALDPTEHAWMLSVVDGNYDTMVEYLSDDFSLFTKRDFVSGFTAIHWLAKYGRGETLIKLLRLAERRGWPVNVNLKASGGFSPLHIAAMHGQYMVLKILVGAFGADVDAMDYSGRRAWQYLKSSSPAEMRELLGAPECEWELVGYENTNNNSSCGVNYDKSDIPEGELHISPSARTNEPWRLGSFRQLVAPLLFFGRAMRRAAAVHT